MSEQLPDPMPDDMEDKVRIEKQLAEMRHLDRVVESEEREEKVHHEIDDHLDEGSSPSEVIEKMGGEEELTRLIGDKNLADLKDYQEDRPMREEEARPMSEDELRVWSDISELHLDDVSMKEIVDRIGYERIKDVLGKETADSFLEGEE